MTPEAFEAREGFRTGGRPGGGPRGDEEIDRGQGLLVQPEGFSHAPTDPVAHNCRAGDAQADGHAKAGMPAVVCHVVDSEEGVAEAAPSLARTVEFSRRAQLLRGLEAVPRSGARQRDRPTVSR